MYKALGVLPTTRHTKKMCFRTVVAEKKELQVLIDFAVKEDKEIAQ
jgi:hypothetical protein